MRLGIYIYKVQMLRSCRLWPHESREAWQQHGWGGEQSVPNQRHGCSDNHLWPWGSRWRLWQVQMWGMRDIAAPGRGPAPRRDAAASRRPGSPVIWCSHSPLFGFPGWAGGAAASSPLSRPGKHDPLCGRVGVRNPTSAAPGGDLWGFQTFCAVMTDGKSLKDEEMCLLRTSGIIWI